MQDFAAPTSGPTLGKSIRPLSLLLIRVKRSSNSISVRVCAEAADSAKPPVVREHLDEAAEAASSARDRSTLEFIAEKTLRLL